MVVFCLGLVEYVRGEVCGIRFWHDERNFCENGGTGRPPLLNHCLFRALWLGFFFFGGADAVQNWKSQTVLEKPAKNWKISWGINPRVPQQPVWRREIEQHHVSSNMYQTYVYGHNNFIYNILQDSGFQKKHLKTRLGAMDAISWVGIFACRFIIMHLRRRWRPELGVAGMLVSCQLIRRTPSTMAMQHFIFFAMTSELCLFLFLNHFVPELHHFLTCDWQEHWLKWHNKIICGTTTKAN